MVEKRPALGRGLSALIPDSPTPAPPPAADRSLEIDTDLLRPNKFQPRTHIDDDRIEELVAIDPIATASSSRSSCGRPSEGYEIIAGERRWRAAQRAGLLKVPVVVRDIPEDRLLAVALIENIQREDLNPIEEAVAYRRLSDEFHLTQEQIADAVGKDRSSIANYVRLLRLPQEVRANVASNALSMGHARALLALRRRAGAAPPRARHRRAQPLGARDRSAGQEGGGAGRRETRDRKDVHTRAAEEKLKLALGTRVRIVRKGKGGRIEIDFTSEDELQRLYELLTERSAGSRKPEAGSWKLETGSWKD